MQAKGTSGKIHVLSIHSRMKDESHHIVSSFCVQLGANAILAVSLAVCKAGAVVNGIPLYKVERACINKLVPSRL